MLATLPSLAKYSLGNPLDESNLNNLLSSLQFLESCFFSAEQSRDSVQQFLRQSTIVDILLKIMEVIGSDKVPLTEYERVKP